jgi:hypothetical protein
VEDEDPAAVRLGRTNFPALERDAVGGADFEIFFGGAGAGEHGGRLSGAFGVEIHRVEDGGANEITGGPGKDREKRQAGDEQDREPDFESPSHS